jgi:anti-sigma factor RsiW
MTCQELVELVTDYFEGALPAEDAARFEQHIDHCVWCTRYLEQMRVTIRTVGRLDTDSISPEARETLLGAFRDWRAGVRPLP